MSVSNSHTKFGWILSNGVGGDSINRRIDGWTDGGDNNNYFAFLKKSVGIMSVKRHTFSIQLLAKY